MQQIKPTPDDTRLANAGKDPAADALHAADHTAGVTEREAVFTISATAAPATPDGPTDEAPRDKMKMTTEKMTTVVVPEDKHLVGEPTESKAVADFLGETGGGALLAGEAIVEPDSTPPLTGSARHTILIGVGVLLFFFVGLGSWAMLAPLDSAVIAPGSIVVKGNRKEVQHRDGGFVAEIPVDEGDYVEEGALLVRLDDTEIRANIDRLQAQLISAQARVARLEAEQRGGKRVLFPESLEYQRDDLYIETVLREEEALFKSRIESFEGEIALLEQRIQQMQAQLDGYQALADAHATQIEIIGRQLENFKGLEKRGFESNLNVLELERQEATYVGQRGEALAELAQTRETIGEIRLQIAQIKRRRAEEIAEGLREGHARIAEIEPQLRSANKQLERVELRAPRSGYVLGLNVFAAGSVVRPGEKVLEIVPADELLIVEAKVRPTDITEIQVGMAADVNITAYSQQNLPAAHGIVRSISADRITEERTGATYYTIWVEIEDEAFLALREVALYPGMPAEVMIPTGSRTAFDYLIEPLTQRFERAFKEK